MDPFAALAAGKCGRNAAFALALHGGASNLRGVSGERLSALISGSEAVLRPILEAGQRALAGGATALDTAEAAVRAMEDSGVFNAGRGAIANRAGDVQMDAAVMDGHSGQAGAVGAVRRLRNPVCAARLVMERSGHVMLVAAEAEYFAAEHGAAIVDTGYFQGAGAFRPPGDSDTVGAVALDRDGHLAAATSTGGIRGKLPGRIGDSPLIGAGTYADANVAVSGTGQGEYFMRLVLAHDVAAVMEYRGSTVEQAVARAIRERLAGAGGHGGVIAVDRAARVAMAMNTVFMPRGLVTHGQPPRVEITAPAS
jgi:beta-aspartyl-peptidase (threonine type)